MATIDVIQLFNSAELTDSAAEYYTVGVDNTQIVKITFCNTSSSEKLVSLWLVPSGGSVGDDNQILNDYPIGGGETYSDYNIEGQIIPSGASIYAKADVTSTVTIHGSGIEFTD